MYTLQVGGFKLKKQINMFTGILNLLRSDNALTINKILAKKIGLKEAIVYSAIVSKYFYWRNINELGEDGFFFYTVEDMEADTTLTNKQQLPVIKHLIKLGLIQYTRKAVCAPRRFYIVPDSEKLLELINGESQKRQKRVSRNAKTELPELPKGRITINNKLINNKKENARTRKYHLFDLKSRAKEKEIEQQINSELNPELLELAMKRANDLQIEFPKQYIRRLLQDWQEKELDTKEKVKAYLDSLDRKIAAPNFNKNYTARNGGTKQKQSVSEKDRELWFWLNIDTNEGR